MKNEKAEIVGIVIRIERDNPEVAQDNRIRTKSATESYRSNWDEVFGKKKSDNSHIN